jgi:general L-amino acid transport system permease protein
MPPSGAPPVKLPFWRDARFWNIALQVIAGLLMLTLIAFLLGNLQRNLSASGLQLTFDWLDNEAGLNIGETILPYSPADDYTRALFLGFLNTLRIVLVALVAATSLGVVVGVASFSNNWLLQRLNLLYVEVIRNIPLLLQLVFWYFAVFLQFPRPETPLRLGQWAFFSKTGVYLPWPDNPWRVALSLGAIALLAIAALWASQARTQAIVERGQLGRRYGLIIWLAILAIGLLLLLGLGWQPPLPTGGGQIQAGLRLSLEFAAILTALTIYSGAFIAEVVRGGILAVSKGQWEAAKSLGLKPGQTLQLVAIPQALQVIVPSLNSQYINIAKNSSLAIAVGYPDMYSVASTALNQTGRPIEVFLILMATYLGLDLVISLIMNQVNRWVQLRER